jgi:hypothetical protein
MTNVPMPAQIQKGKKTWRYDASSLVRLTEEDDGAEKFRVRGKLDDDDGDDDELFKEMYLS